MKLNSSVINIPFTATAKGHVMAAVVISCPLLPICFEIARAAIIISTKFVRGIYPLRMQICLLLFQICLNRGRKFAKFHNSFFSGFPPPFQAGASPICVVVSLLAHNCSGGYMYGGVRGATMWGGAESNRVNV